MTGGGGAIIFEFAALIFAPSPHKHTNPQRPLKVRMKCFLAELRMENLSSVSFSLYQALFMVSVFPLFRCEKVFATKRHISEPEKHSGN